jgi:hypothetical protein
MLKTAFSTSAAGENRLANGFVCSDVGAFRLKNVSVRIVSPRVIQIKKIDKKTDEVPFRRLLAG